MKRIALLLPLVCLVASGQITQTPNIGLNVVGAHTPNWNIPFNQNTVKLDTIFGGAYPVPGALFVSFLGIPKGATNPATCVTGQIFFNTSVTAGQNLYGCTATNTWTQQAGGGGGGSGTVTSVAAPSGSWPTWLVPSVTNPTTTPSLSTSFILGNFPTLNQNTTGNAATATALAANPVDCPGSQFANAIAANGDLTCAVPAGGGNVNNTGTPTSGQLALWTASTVIQGVTALPAANFPAQTGDITNSAGSLATTLAAVGSVGSCGDSTHSCQLTFDTKGRETARANVAISGVGGAASSIVSGPLSGIPGTGAAGNVYFATDQPAGEQLYQWDATNHYTQTFLHDTTIVNTAGSFGVNLSQFCQFTNSCPVASLWSFAIGQDYVEQASGTTPSGGKLHIYANTDHTFHQVTSGGVDSGLGGGSVITKWVKAYNTTGQSIPATFSPLTTLTFNTSDPGTTDATMHSTSSNTGRLVAPTTGIYEGACTLYSTTAPTGNTGGVVQLNGTQTVGNFSEGGSPSSQIGLSAPFSTPMTAGDYVVCNIGASVALTTTAGNGNTQFYMHLVH